MSDGQHGTHIHTTIMLAGCVGWIPLWSFSVWLCSLCQSETRMLFFSPSSFFWFFQRNRGQQQGWAPSEKNKTYPETTTRLQTALLTFTCILGMKRGYGYRGYSPVKRKCVCMERDTARIFGWGSGYMEWYHKHWQH